MSAGRTASGHVLMAVCCKHSAPPEPRKGKSVSGTDRTAIGHSPKKSESKESFFLRAALPLYLRNRFAVGETLAGSDARTSAFPIPGPRMAAALPPLFGG